MAEIITREFPYIDHPLTPWAFDEFKKIVGNEYVEYAVFNSPSVELYSPYGKLIVRVAYAELCFLTESSLSPMILRHIGVPEWLIKEVADEVETDSLYRVIISRRKYDRTRAVTDRTRWRSNHNWDWIRIN